MTALQSFTAAPTEVADLDPYRFPAVYIDDHIGERPEEGYARTHISHGFLESGDYQLPAPVPGTRLSVTLEPADRRRLDLHAALTTAGIAPLPGDLDAIEALCTLDDFTHIALQRWITRSA
ncbi:hypothetical protein ACFV9D_06565 [Streptomyces sp. NPDC059875]|uniref:hypothetical protein n=1 Tax=unclassified Streptomyces TaxID=2593676 RepID=UPI003666EF02